MNHLNTLREGYTEELYALRDYMKGPHEHEPSEVWNKFAEWVFEEENEDVLEKLKELVGNDAEIEGPDDVQTDVNYDYYWDLPAEMQVRFQAHIKGDSVDDLYPYQADAPTWMHMSGSHVVKPSTWLIHFTDDACSIASEGFTKGTDDMTRLGLTKWTHKSAKKYPGYVFAFQAGSNDAEWAASKGMYGKEAVMFMGAGVEAYHYGDEEDQVMVWGPSVEVGSFVALTQYDGNWGVRGNRKWKASGNREFVVEGTFDEVCTWVMEHWKQYRNVIF